MDKLATNDASVIKRIRQNLRLFQAHALIKYFCGNKYLGSKIEFNVVVNICL